MFQRFTDRSRRVVVLAQEEARLLSHNYIGTEHLLLGLAHEGEGVAGRALQAFEIDVDEIRGAVLAVIGQGSKQPSGHIPFTPRAKKVLELSLRESLQLGHNYIGTEHLLLGIVREGEGVGAQALQSLGVELHKVRQTLISLMAGVTPSPPGRRTPQLGPPPVAAQFDPDVRRGGFVGVVNPRPPIGVVGVLAAIVGLTAAVVERPLAGLARTGLVLLGAGMVGLVVAGVADILGARGQHWWRRLVAWGVGTGVLLVGAGAVFLVLDALLA